MWYRWNTCLVVDAYEAVCDVVRQWNYYTVALQMRFTWKWFSGLNAICANDRIEMTYCNAFESKRERCIRNWMPLRCTAYECGPARCDWARLRTTKQWAVAVKCLVFESMESKYAGFLRGWSFCGATSVARLTNIIQSITLYTHCVASDLIVYVAITFVSWFHFSLEHSAFDVQS